MPDSIEYKGAGLLFILLFISVFKIRRGVVDTTLLAFVIAVSLILVSNHNLLFNNAYTEMELPKQIFNPLLVFSGLVSYIVAMTLFHRPENIFYILKYGRAGLSLLATYIIIRWVTKKYDGKTILYVLGVILLIHPILMYLQIVFPPLDYFLTQVMPFADNRHWYRVNGLLNGYVPGGIFLALSTLYFGYMADEFDSKLFGSAFLLSAPLFPLSSITGGLLYTVVVGFLLFKLLYNRNTKPIKISAVVASSVVSIIVGILILFPSFSADMGIDQGAKRVIALFGGDTNVSSNPRRSLRILLSSYSLPPTLSEFFIGNLEPSKSTAASTKSDAGIITNMHALGITGTTLLVYSKLKFAINGNNAFLSMFLIMWMIVFFKVDTFYGRIFMDYFMIIFVLSVHGDETIQSLLSFKNEE